jgi:2-dehydropantoate 2-reductase
VSDRHDMALTGTPDPAPRIVILGAGAVGVYIGALLSRGGADITLIGRARILDPMKAGVVIRTSAGQTVTATPMTTTTSNGLGQFALAFLTVKAYSVAAVLDEVSHLVGDAGVVIALQNGVGSDQLLVGRLGPDRVVAGTSTISVGLDEHGVVNQYTDGGLAWASYGAVPHRIDEVLRLSGLPVSHPATADSLRWSKLLLNSVGAAQSAIMAINLDAIVADRRLFAIECWAFRERLTTMSAAGIKAVDLPGYRVGLASMAMKMPIPLTRLLLGRRMARGRGGKPPTLRGDVQSGGPSENQFLNGATVDLASRVGVKTPVNAALAELVDDVQESPVERNRFHENPEAMIAALYQHGIRF